MVQARHGLVAAAGQGRPTAGGGRHPARAHAGAGAGGAVAGRGGGGDHAPARGPSHRRDLSPAAGAGLRRAPHRSARPPPAGGARHRRRGAGEDPLGLSPHRSARSSTGWWASTGTTTGRFDYVSNLHPASYPDGNDVEVVPLDRAGAGRPPGHPPARARAHHPLRVGPARAVPHRQRRLGDAGWTCR